MAKVKDLKGLKFGRLTVVSFIETRGKSKHSYWLCKCECGNTKEVRGSHLLDGNVISCKCYNKEVSSIFLKKYATSDKHKGSGNPMWKGDRVGYMGIHTWLRDKFIKGPCNHCGTLEKSRDWALIKGKKHMRRKENYIPLCKSCHLKYDYTEERKTKIFPNRRKLLLIRNK